MNSQWVGIMKLWYMSSQAKAASPSRSQEPTGIGAGKTYMQTGIQVQVEKAEKRTHEAILTIWQLIGEKGVVWIHWQGDWGIKQVSKTRGCKTQVTRSDGKACSSLVNVAVRGDREAEYAKRCSHCVQVLLTLSMFIVLYVYKFESLLHTFTCACKLCSFIWLLKGLC